MSTDYSRALGARLRAIRNQQGLSLQGVEDKSHGRWKAFRPDARESRETPILARQARVKAPVPATSCVHRTTGRLRSAAAWGSAARPPPPQRERRRAQSEAHRAACCLFPYRETDSAASQCRARQDRPRLFPWTHGSCRHRPRARTRNTRGAAAAAPPGRRPLHRDRFQFGSIAPLWSSCDLADIQLHDGDSILETAWPKSNRPGIPWIRKSDLWTGA